MITHRDYFPLCALMRQKAAGVLGVNTRKQPCPLEQTGIAATAVSVNQACACKSCAFRANGTSSSNARKLALCMAGK
eukprot:505742-Amphidinium_carterae.1